MIAIISDIHGNYEALQEVLKVIDANKIETIYCLGDVVGYYPQINECCDELRRRNAICVMGNHDWYFATDSTCPRSQSVNDCLNFQKRIITKANLQWIKSLPDYRIINNINMVHGGWINHIDEYLNPSKKYFEKYDNGLYLSGHTHVQKLEKYADIIYCNPGSVGQPRDNINTAAFAILDDDNRINLKRVSYDIKKIEKLMEDAGFSGYYYQCLRVGAKRLGYYENPENDEVTV